MIEKVVLPYSNNEFYGVETFTKNVHEDSPLDDGLEASERGNFIDDAIADPVSAFMAKATEAHLKITSPFYPPAAPARVDPNLTKRFAKTVETKIGASIVVAELDEHNVVTRTYLKAEEK
jgi:hypothetical protein